MENRNNNASAVRDTAKEKMSRWSDEVRLNAKKDTEFARRTEEKIPRFANRADEHAYRLRSGLDENKW